MNNFQLYRTNLLLGGQMKWDLVVGNTNSELFVYDFHLTPISNNIPFAFKSEETLLNNTHQENIRAYYNANKGNFYDEGLDSEFCTSWPLMYTEDTLHYPNMYSNAYDMGCKRIKSFKKYNKQFEFFCPLWIEHLTDDITFTITVSNIVNDKNNTKHTIASRQLSLKNLGINYHDRFVKYFNDYIEYIGLDKGSDDLLDINLSNYTSNATGLDITSGLVVIKSNSDLVNNILSRERPLLETDDMLIRMFSDNKIICKQLFNFNICFNLYDVLPNVISKQMTGESISVSVDVKIGNEKLELKDFDTNYEFIQRQYTVGKNINIDNDVNALKLNVFDYLNDYKCVDLIDKNKFCQSRCHWSLNDNNNYIFNVYNGFSGFHIDKENDKYLYYENNHQYGTTPNTLLDKYSKTDNSIGWINVEYFNDNNDDYNRFYSKYILEYKTKMLNGTLFYDSTYINNIKYVCSYKDIDSDNTQTLCELYILGVVVNKDLIDKIKKLGSDITLNDDTKYIIKQMKNKDMKNSDYLIIATDNIDNLSFYNFKNNINKWLSEQASLINDENNQVLNTLNRLNVFLTKNIDPKLVELQSSLKYYIANSPSNNTTEITYCKDNITTEYILRYDGKIKPTFVNRISQRYKKEALQNNSDKLINVYGKYSKSQLKPLYPSINYCAIQSIEDCNSKQYPIKLDINSINEPVEYAWFNDGKNIVLKEKIEFDINESELINNDILTIVENKIKEYYWNIVDLSSKSINIDTDITYDKIKLQFIYDTYSIDYDHIYDNDQYKYHITLNLK